MPAGTSKRLWRNPLLSQLLFVAGGCVQVLANEVLSKDQLGDVYVITAKLVETMSSLREGFAFIQIPFAHARGNISLAEYFVPSIPSSDQLEETMLAAHLLLENYHSVYFRGVGALAMVV